MFAGGSANAQPHRAGYSARASDPLKTVDGPLAHGVTAHISLEARSKTSPLFSTPLIT